MASTIFIALQCYQCSTMQVKQQKKSSNKWTCVVCNQKQSVRKVFAQGYIAKDIRNFVQSFNMSRNQSPTETLIPTSQLGTDFDHRHQTKRRSDWTEYLDPEDNQKQNILEDESKEGEFEVKIVTEMPREMFKKPKFDDGEDNNKLYKPFFSKRNTNTNTTNSSYKHAITKGKEASKREQTKAKGASKWSDFVTENDEETRYCQPTTAERSLKWNDYITQEDEGFLIESGRDFADHVGQWSSDVLETTTNDDRVEDDIHPDFM